MHGTRDVAVKGEAAGWSGWFTMETFHATHYEDSRRGRPRACRSRAGDRRRQPAPGVPFRSSPSPCVPLGEVGGRFFRAPDCRVVAHGHPAGPVRRNRGGRRTVSTGRAMSSVNAAFSPIEPAFATAEERGAYDRWFRARTTSRSIALRRLQPKL